MQEDHRARLSFVQTGLPWVVAAGALLIYLVTLNRWVTLDSLPYVAKVTGWDWTLPHQAPLFFLLTYPIRWLPPSWQPLCLNLFSAVCSALVLALLARSVALLPHDRTHEQRQRERSEFSLLTIPGAWLPPVLAALVCGLELTFWEHSTAATNESLDLLVFAYVIRCLLEFRLERRDSWLFRMAFAYGLGTTNSFAFIGFFPCLVAALFWMKGLEVFEFRFLVRLVACGLAGLSLYLLLPLVWVLGDTPSVTFWQALRANLATQKMTLWDMPGLRSRALILCITSLVPVAVIGIRWPSTFGDTSAAGALFANIMFRMVHIVFLAACLAVALNVQFSPRMVGSKLPYAPSFLSFYYLAALSIGYFSGYLLLVFGQNSRSKSWRRRSERQLLFNRLVVAAVWVTLLAMPAALVYRNLRNLRTTNGPLLNQFAQLSSRELSSNAPNGAIVLSDDPYGLLLLSASLGQAGNLNKYILVHTRSLLGSDYHRRLNEHFPTHWPNWFTNQPPDELIDDGSLLRLITVLGRSNPLYYLHPSFGYYFEQFYIQPQGLIYRLANYPTNSFLLPALEPKMVQANKDIWQNLDPALKDLAAGIQIDSRTAQYVSHYYSRALNFWGATLQQQPLRSDNRAEQLEQAGNCFQLAANLSTNNIPAESNLEFNRAWRMGQPRQLETAKSIEDKFGIYRGWERMLIENGPFDHPDYCWRLGQIFAQQGLLRQAAIQVDRVCTLEPTNLLAQAALADIYLSAREPALALQEVERIRSKTASQSISPELALELVRLDATGQFDLGKTNLAEKLLLDASGQYEKTTGLLDTLLVIYARTGRMSEAFDLSEKIIRADPDRVQSYINQAGLYLKNQEPDKAISAIERLQEKMPSQPQALLYKIYIQIQTKDYAKARSAVDSLLSVEPDNLEGLLYKGVVEIESKAYASAIEPLSTVLVKQPSNPNALRNRALAYLQLGNLTKAEKDYDALRRLPAREYAYVAYYGLGDIAYRRHHPKDTLKYYNLYLQNVPQDNSPTLEEEKKMVRDRLKELPESRR